MTIQAAFDVNGNLTGFYDTTLTYPGGIPAGAVTITAAQQAGLLAGQAAGQSVIKGADGTPTLAALTLAQVQAAQIATLAAQAQAAIVGGYSSAALGSAYTYPSTPTDQANMQASVVASLLPNLASGWTTPFWCADGTGAWAMRNHTAAQIQQAGSDGKAMIQAAQVQLATLTAQVQAATTNAAVQAITW